ncbi:hypothetical protein DWX58_11865 [Pseudoflavonifractor sp. AF19-9AC]|uniref:cucumopine synthase-related protein n=1 Tax=Pseudoflavonifractor sp. AF19-9AC TaxID=2292244 RepID=UPI000E48C9A8|nr:hypothetical protein [Pseudoflavonifractor sp. AF19-9AC]RHR06655.1 hypothetical protein DWX58_11865 [Pseudoflavonifractor sp. AF19-9AC]
MKTFKQLKAEIEEQIAVSSLEPDQDVLDVFRYSISKAGAGYPQDNQIFTTWFYGAPDCGYVTDWCYFLVELARDEYYSMEELCKIARFWFVQPSHFGEYCGLYKQYYFTKEIDKIMDTLTRQEFVELLSAFRAYIANVNVWVFQYFPWGVGQAFMRKDQKYYEEALSLCNG